MNLPANTIATEPNITTHGELSDDALEAIAALLVDAWSKSQTPSPDATAGDGFTFRGNEE